MIEDFRFKDCYFTVDAGVFVMSTLSVCNMKEAVWDALHSRDRECVKIYLHCKSKGRLVRRYETADMFIISNDDELEDMIIGIRDVLKHEVINIDY